MEYHSKNLICSMFHVPCSIKEGFTIIELVISIFILSVAIVGIFSAFSIMIILTSDAADRLTATYLAQEGMEIVRNIRDTNWLNMDAGSPVGATWLDGLTGCDVSSVGCKADYTAKTMQPWINGAADYLKTDASGFYNYTAGAKTKFKRKIIITFIADYIMKVSVQVSWNEKATILNSSGFSADNCAVGNNCIIAEGTLYDWYNYVPSSSP